MNIEHIFIEFLWDLPVILSSFWLGYWAGKPRAH